MTHEYEGRILEICSFDPLVCDFSLHLKADVGFDMTIYFGTLHKRMRLLNCDKATQKFDCAGVATHLLNRNLRIITHRGLRHDEYAAECFDVNGESINQVLQRYYD